MPTYQYACTACGQQLEAVQKFSDDPLSECDSCGGRLRKVFSAVGVVFKGSGFYRTDSRSDNGSKSRSEQSAKQDSPSASSESNGQGEKSGTSASQSGGSGSGSSESAKSSDNGSGAAKGTGKKSSEKAA